MTSVNGDSKTKQKKIRDSSPSSSSSSAPSSPAPSLSDKDDNPIRQLSDEDKELIRKKRNLVSESMLTVVECVYENYISSIKNKLAVQDTEQLWQEVELLFRDGVKKRVIEPFEAVMEANITDEVRSSFFIDNHKPIEDLFLKSMDVVIEKARSSKNVHLFIHVLKEFRPRLRDSIKKAKYCCDCVTNYFISTTDNFFEIPCTRPHTLVWAKTKGCPFWPAKLIGVRQKKCTVLYFGEHEIDEQIPLSKSTILRLTRKYPSGRDMKEIESNRQLAKTYQEAMKQLKGHIDLIKKEYGESFNVYAPDNDSTLRENHPIYYKVRHVAPVTPHENQRVEERNEEQDDEQGLNIPALKKAEDFWTVTARHRVPSSLLDEIMSSEHFDIRANPLLSANVWFKPEEQATYMKSLSGCFGKDVVCQSDNEKQSIVIRLVPTSTSSSVEEVQDLPHNPPSPSNETAPILPSVVNKDQEEKAPSEKPKKREIELVEDSESHTLPEHNLPQSNKKLKTSHEDKIEKRPHKTLEKKQDIKKFDSKPFTEKESETPKHQKSDSKKEDDIRKSPKKDSDAKQTKSDVKLVAPSLVDNPKNPRQNKGHNSAFGDFLTGLDEVNKQTFLRKPSLKKVEIKEKSNKPGDQEMKSDSREDLIEKVRKLRVDLNRSKRLEDEQTEICRKVNEKNNQSKVERLQKEHEAEMQKIHQDLAIISDKKELEVKLLEIKKHPHCFECSSPLDKKIKWSQIDLDPEVNCVAFSHLDGFGHYFCSKTCRQDSFAVHKGPCKYCTTKVHPPSKTTT